MSLRHLLRRGLLYASVATTAGVAYSALIEPSWIEVRSISLPLPRLSSGFCGYCIVHISDLHLSDWMTVGRLARVVRLVNAQSPDLIVITGDFISRRPEAHLRDLACSLGSLKAPDGVVAVLGNHDHRAYVGMLRATLVAAGVRELANDVLTLRRGNNALHIAGVDDPWVGRDQLDRVLEALPTEGAAILLAHEPDFADKSAATGRFDLQLSGHTHGGQLVAPLIGPLTLPYFGRKYPAGHYQVEEMIQYTNRGVGMIRPFVRFNCRPEITVFRLHACDGCACASS